MSQEQEAFEKLNNLSLNNRAKKENVNLVFIGHVDAGKSTLGGQLLYLTDMVDQRTLEKYEKESKELNRESWYLSWALDTGEEERNKGITVECGMAYFETPKRRFTLLDAPGHKNYVPSMISGASQADVAVLVISARQGEFETGFEKGGQTREHALLVKTLGVKRLIVVINKMDDPSVRWAKERFDEIVNKLTPFLKATGFSEGKGDVEFIPISGLKGHNIKEEIPVDACNWYKGKTLLNTFDTMPSIKRSVDGPFIMPVSGKFREMGTNVAGKIESGSVNKGDNLLMMPNKETVEVVGISLEEEDVDRAICGENVKLRLKGVEEEDICVGFVLCNSDRPVKASKRFEAQLLILQIKNIITCGFSAVMHIHAIEEPISIASLDYTIDKKTGERKASPRFVRKNESVIATIECDDTICLESSADCESLGRFTLRDEGSTIAVGKVLKVLD